MQEKIKQAIISLKHNGELDKIIKHTTNNQEKKFLKHIKNAEDEDLMKVPLILIYAPDEANALFLKSIIFELIDMEIEDGKSKEC